MCLSQPAIDLYTSLSGEGSKTESAEYALLQHSEQLPLFVQVPSPPSPPFFFLPASALPISHISFPSQYYSSTIFSFFFCLRSLCDRAHTCENNDWLFLHFGGHVTRTWTMTGKPCGTCGRRPHSVQPHHAVFVASVTEHGTSDARYIYYMRSIPFESEMCGRSGRSPVLTFRR